MTNALYAIKDLLPNPFRRMDHYPIRREKVEALKESLAKTGFWDNVVGRSQGKKIEIAYGHHRWVALQEFYGPRHQVGIIVKDLSDEIMLQIMARENMEEWGTSAIVEIETVQAVIEAYAAGKINLDDPDGKTSKAEMRFAPSFIPDDAVTTRSAHPYSAMTVAKFLGWLTPKGDAQAKVRIAITALQFIEENLLNESDFAGLNTSECEAVITEARRIRIYRENIAKAHEERAEEAKREVKKLEKEEREAQSNSDAHAAKIARFRAEQRRKDAEMEAYEEREKARKSATLIGQTISSGFKKKGYGVRQARDLAEQVDRITRNGPPPHIEKYLRDTLSAIERILQPETDKQAERLEEILKYRESLDEITLIDATKTLEQLANRAATYAQKFSKSNHEMKAIKR